MTDYNLPAFPPFSQNENPNTVTHRWNKWKSKLENLMVGLNIKNTNRKRALLRHYIGDEIDDIFIMLPDTGQTYETAIAALDRHFQSQRNVEYEIYCFRQLRQMDQESLDQYVTRLKRSASTCEFQEEDREIKSQIILGCKSSKLRRHALQHPSTSLSELICFGRVNDTAERHARTIEDTVSSTVNVIANKSMHHMSKVDEPRNITTRPCICACSNKTPRGREVNVEPLTWQTSNYSRGTTQEKMCNFCGQPWHRLGLKDCKAQGKRCQNCGKLNHFDIVCKQKLFSNRNKQTQQQANKHHKRNMNYITDVKKPDTSQDDYVLATNRDKTTNSFETVKLTIGNRDITFVIDSGASVNLLSNPDYQSLIPKPSLQKSACNIYIYGSNKPLAIAGSTTLPIKYGEKNYKIQFVVPKGEGLSLLSKDTAVKMNLIQFVHSIPTTSVLSQQIEKQYPALFQGVGKIKNVEVKLSIDTSIAPVTQKLRRIPFHVRAAVEKELQDLLTKDIIEEVPTNEPTPWISPIVVVPKKQGEGVRICIDMKAANRAIQRERSIAPTLDDIIYTLNGACIFSKLDMNKGYHQLKLHRDSRPLTTFVTHLGLFRYKRLHFGVNTAAEIFQQEIAKLLGNIPNAINVSDDILVFGKNADEHDRALEQTLNTLEEAGVTLNQEKCLFEKSSLKFLGHVFSKEGITPDKGKIEAICNLQSPSNPSEVRSLMGMVTFTSKFIPHLAIIAKPLRILTRQSTPWKWTIDHQQAFLNIKKALSQASTLAYFNVDWKTEIWTDAGPEGLGAILVQRNDSTSINILAYASHALTDTEKRYSQIEKEALALTWATSHFHLYVYGNRFKIITDHKPLITLFNNSNNQLSARLECWRIKLQQYNYNVEFSPGKRNPADYLSRHPMTNSAGILPAEDLAEKYVQYVANQAIPRTLTLEEIQNATVQDGTLRDVIKSLLSGNWNTKRSQKDSSRWKSLVKIKHELSTNKQRNIVLRGTRIVIPEKLQSTVLDIAHLGHQGISKTKSLLREKVWFPGIDDKTEKLISRCLPCNTVTPQHGTTPLLTTPLPDRPWQHVNIDHKGPLPSSEYLLVVVDQYSRFPIVEIVSSTASKTNIQKLDSIFAMFGIPETITTDNGSPFNSNEFASFARRLNFKHRKIIPHWPQANGGVERFNRTLNKALQIAFSTRGDWRQELNSMLRDYRSTPQSTTNCPPSDLIFAYKGNNLLPDARHLNQPTDRDNINKRDAMVKERQKMNHDNNRKLLAPPNIGDQVLVKEEVRLKTTPYYQKEPLIVTEIKGPMITAKNQRKSITRHRSFYKVIPQEETDQSEDYPHENSLRKTNEFLKGNYDQTDEPPQPQQPLQKVDKQVLKTPVIDITSQQSDQKASLRKNIKPPQRLIEQ